MNENMSTRRAALLGLGAGLIVPGIVGRPLPAAAQGASQGAPQQTIDISRARTNPIPIAIPDFAGSAVGHEIAGVVANDLQNCGLFRPVDRAAFIQPADAAAQTPRFEDWKAIGAQGLTTGRVEQAGGQIRVEFRLWDVLSGSQLQGTAFTAPAGNWRRIGHLISDVIYERMLGEKGYFDTRICYVSESGPRDRRVRRLAIMDQDGANNRILTDGRFAALTPRWHPTANRVVFMSYNNNQPQVYLLDIDSGRQEVLGSFPGMTLSPRFSPDGSSVVLSSTRGGAANIFSVSLGSRQMRQLTSGSALDVSPCYSPDGSQIVFNSDRGGDQQLYVMGAGGGGANRISFGRGRYATPVWSPRGDLIAFTRIAGGQFAIGVMRPDGSGERILTEGWSMEGPTFCPNGRVMMFFRESQSHDARGSGYSARISSIDITGFNERPVPTPGDASDPAWSPLLS